MKTKIIYISGSEIFDMNDIRTAFDEVRQALNLDKTTVLFGVPVDAEDAGFATNITETKPVETNIIDDAEIVQVPETEPVMETTEITIETEEIPVESTKETPEIIEEIVDEEKIQDDQQEPVAEQPVKKRGRPRKTPVVEQPVDVKTEEETIDQTPESAEDEETVVPILSILSSNDDEENLPENEKEESTEEEPITSEPEAVTIEQISIEKQEINIIHEIPENESVQNDSEKTIVEDEAETDNDEESLEKLLSAMTPLQEDVLEEPVTEQPISQPEDISVDATLQQLASEFVENQDKISAENKSSSRSKIGKLRNILPFKQSKHKDQGLGDLFGWAGIAANDEDFSVPGFFTNVASKK